MSKQWAIILGCSTGHGAATALALAKEGYGIIGFHLDRGPIKKEAETLKKEIQKINGGHAHFWNENAADKETRELICSLPVPNLPWERDR